MTHGAETYARDSCSLQKSAAEVSETHTTHAYKAGVHGSVSSGDTLQESAWPEPTAELITWFNSEDRPERIETPSGSLQDWSRVFRRLRLIINAGPTGHLSHQLEPELLAVRFRYGQ